ncbi:hypothetical protein ACH4OW_11405 [Streptomyces sp. NPDC017056]|uniref:hypothetical protein n=1 Tax=Streptomyces sp. NPDC017056 TaxID=3364973 RepID=UPI0037955EE2
MPPAGYADPVSELVHTAVVCQPLDAVARLVDLLERSPHGRCAVDEALRTAATELPVHEVAQLVHLLSQPPRPYDGADQVLRTAAEQRPVAEVSHLMTLLHQPPHAARSGSETTRTVAGRRPVEELAELIDTLAEERAKATAHSPSAHAAAPVDGDDEPASHGAARGLGSLAVADKWLPWLAGAGVLLCGAAHFPMGIRSGSSVSAETAAIGLPAVCALLATLLFIKNTIPRLAAAVVLSAAVLAQHLLESGLFARSPFPHLLHNTFLPPLPAFAVTGLAVFLALAALARALAASRHLHAAAPLPMV